MEESNNNYGKNIGDVLKNRVFQKPAMDDVNRGATNTSEYVVDGINALSMYSIIFHGFTKEFRLQPSCIVLLAIITTFHREGLTCWLGQESLSSLTNTSIPTVHKNLQHLEALGLIQRGLKHPRHGTIQWSIGPKGEQTLEEIQRRLKQTKEERDTYKRNKASTQRIFGQ